MAMGSLLSWGCRRRLRVKLQQMLLNDFVDLRLGVRLQPRLHLLIRSSALNDHEDRTGRSRFSDHLLELARHRQREVMSVDGDDAIAFLHADVMRRSVEVDGFHDDAAMRELDDLQAEIATADEHAPDLLLALARRGIALLPFFGVHCSSREDEGDEGYLGDSGNHSEAWVLWPTLNVVDQRGSCFTNQKMSNEFRVIKGVTAKNEVHRTRLQRENREGLSLSVAKR